MHFHRFLFIREKKKDKVFYAFAYVVLIKKSKNMILMY